MDMKTIQPINADTFARYGKVIEYEDKPGADLFQVRVDAAEPAGWRIAVMKVTAQSFSRLNCHPNTVEAFDPVQGVSLLVVAEPERPRDFEVFLLDRPVCIDKRVWHVVLTLTASSLVKVMENLTVDSESVELPGEYSLKMLGMDRGQ